MNISSIQILHFKVPAVVINLIWDTEVYEQLLQQGIKLSLSEEALSKIMTLT